ncbi:MAG: PIG-L family deacetylase [Caldilineales bacterium]|nr:PIG-L family deacetylase [Caldilineales bacterium]MDW8317908.1 PIG-L family deacetylase [Anaerolineae bacterium]
MPSASSPAAKRLLALFAHPDDEVSVGGTLARCAAEGVAVTLVCATRGEAATIFSPPEYGATRENLAQVRTRELECACRALGIQDLRWLDWPDGRVAELEEAEATAQVVAILRQVRPQVMFTHPSHGGYGHPDHLAIHRIALAAWEAAADPAYRPDLGPAWAVAKLYARVTPASFFALAPTLQGYRVALNGQQLPLMATPDEEVAVVVEVADFSERRRAAWECHRSQHNPRGFFNALPEEARQLYFSREWLQLVAHRLGDGPTPGHRLWDGIAEEGGQPAAEPQPATPQGTGAEEAAQPAAPGATLIPRLLAALRARRTYLAIYQAYRRATPKADFAALLDGLIEDTQESLAELSRALRLLGRSPVAVGVNERLLAQGEQRKGTLSKLNFLLVGANQSLAWYKGQRSEDDPPDVQALWQRLEEAELRHQSQIKALLAQIELAAAGSTAEPEAAEGVQPPDAAQAQPPGGRRAAPKEARPRARASSSRPAPRKPKP